ncbi:MAG: hypothetical protein KAG66_14670, partial [Methylococcales bacterium]|nr:hypothetical protein [Methylococcales bacterium]
MVSQIISFARGGSRTQPNIAILGNLVSEFSVEEVGGATNQLYIKSTSKHTNVTDITAGGDFLPNVEFSVVQGVSSGGVLPLGALLEASSFAQIVKSELGTPPVLQELLDTAYTKIQQGKSLASIIRNVYSNARARAVSLTSLDVGSPAGNQAVLDWVAEADALIQVSAVVFERLKEAERKLRQVFRTVTTNVGGDPTGGTAVTVLVAEVAAVLGLLTTFPEAADLLTKAEAAKVSLAQLTVTDPSVATQFHTGLSHIADFSNEGVLKAQTIVPIVTGGSPSAVSYLTSANAITSNVGFTTASLTQVLQSVLFTNRVESNA